MQLKQDDAEVFALHVLAWLAAQEDIVPVFLGATGASESDLRTRAGDADFLISVLDFVMLDDAWVIQCCDTLQVPYERIMQAKAGLPGGAEVSWT